MSFSHSPFTRYLNTLIIIILIFFSASSTQSTSGYVSGTDDDGNSIWLLDARQPSLYTSTFGDCLGSSLINVTRFDAAYYKDNMTVLFHLQGNTNVKNESLMMHIGVYAYGESRFDLLFNPCNANINSLCPMNRSVPIEANGIIPIAPSDVAGIPPIALSIPDFEGQAILRIYANSTRREIGCYSAVVTNGVSLSHPAAVGSVLGIFTIVALVASFATAIYGDKVVGMRTHYAHSLSVFVVFSVFQHIFFTGALSLSWPSVLVAFWSNFAWAGGMIYSQNMQNSINNFIRSNKANISMAGAAGFGDSLNGGVPPSKIYGRALSNSSQKVSPWYGQPVTPGLPLPGNFSGFSGTLAAQNIPASNAFMTGFLWLLILMVIVGASIGLFKLSLELLSKTKHVKNETLAYFRSHWVGYTIHALLRTCFIAFFMMMLLTTYQFSLKSSAGPAAIAAIVFIAFLVGMVSITGIACYHRLKFGHYQSEPDPLLISSTRRLKIIPCVKITRKSTCNEKAEGDYSFMSIPWMKISYVDHDPTRTTVHDDTHYIEKFGWLSARFRRTRWWFFAPWIVYEFIRACFYGGGSGSPFAQLFGLLVVEIIAMIFLIKLKPLEGVRLNALVVYCLSFSKIVTVGLSIAFHPTFKLGRIITTVFGIIIVVVQGILTILLLIAIAVGAMSSWFSIRRNRDVSQFRPTGLRSTREKYYNHIDTKAKDLPPPIKPPTPAEPPAPAPPCFNVSSVRRYPKIEDEDPEFMASVGGDFSASKLSLHPESWRITDSSPPGSGRVSRADSIGDGSVRSAWTTVPWGGRVHRASWSSQQFSNFTDGLVEDYQRNSGGSTTPLNRPAIANFGSSSSSLNGLVPHSGSRRMGSPWGSYTTPQERGS